MPRVFVAAALAAVLAACHTAPDYQEPIVGASVAGEPDAVPMIREVPTEEPAPATVMAPPPREEPAPMAEEHAARVEPAAKVEPTPAVALPTQPMTGPTVSVMWWNVQRMGSPEARGVIARNVDGMHIVALAGVRSERSLARLASELGDSWKYAASPELGEASGHRQRIGLLWDSGAIRMAGALKVDADPDNELTRDVVFAGFTTGGGFDFTVAAVHLYPGHTLAESKAQVSALAGAWDRIQEATPGDRDVILMGDFKLDSDDAAFKALLEQSGLKPTVDDLTFTGVRGRTNFDQIFIHPKHTTEWTGASGTRKFDETSYGGNDAAAARAVSDHRPVWITLRVPETDND